MFLPPICTSKAMFSQSNDEHRAPGRGRQTRKTGALVKLGEKLKRNGNLTVKV